jgi:hypothetical protein
MDGKKQFPPSFTFNRPAGLRKGGGVIETDSQIESLSKALYSAQ